MKFKIYFLTKICLVLFLILGISAPNLVWSKSKKVNAVVTVDGKKAVGKTYVKAKSCSPVLAWSQMEEIYNDTNSPIASWDIVIYEHIKGKKLPYRPERVGEKVYSQEGLSQGSHQIATSLAPKTKYFWTIRPQFNDGSKGNWATHNSKKYSWFSNSYNQYEGFPFSLQTPSRCS